MFNTIGDIVGGPGWSAFEIAGLISLQVVFDVYSSQNEIYRSCFNKIVTNIGGDWNESECSFIAPLDGLYYFSYSVGNLPRNMGKIFLIKNFQDDHRFCALIWGTHYNDIDVCSRGCLLSLLKYNRVVFIQFLFWQFATQVMERHRLVAFFIC